MSAPTDGSPPCDIKAERELLASVASYDAGIGRAAEEGLEPSDFYLDKHRHIYAAALELHRSGDPVNEVSINAKLKDSGNLDAVGGENVIYEITATSGDPGSADYFARRIQEMARRRAAVDLGHRLVAAARSGSLEEKGAELVESAGQIVLSQAGAPRLAILNETDIANLPPLEYLVEGLMVAGGSNGLFGPPGAGKSFLGQGLAFSVAAGRHFLGRRVKQGPVLYIAGEGAAGIGRRMAAWKQANEIASIDDFFLVIEPPNFYTGPAPELAAAIEAKLPEPPVLIVGDTLARLAVGADENSARDVGLVMDHWDQLCRRFSATGLMIHHSTKSNPETERGSTAFKGALDHMVGIRPNGDELVLWIEKAKDFALGKREKLHLEPVAESAVLRAGMAWNSPETVDPKTDDLFQTVSEAFQGKWATTAEIRDAANISKATASRLLKPLVDAEKLEVRTGKQGTKEYRPRVEVETVPDCSNPFQTSATDCSVPGGVLKDPPGGTVVGSGNGNGAGEEDKLDAAIAVTRKVFPDAEELAA